MQHLGEQVAALVDGALGDDERPGVLAHLAGCTECRQHVRREQHLKARLTAMDTAPPPPWLVAALADRSRVEQHVGRLDSHRCAVAHAGATAGALCAALTFVALVAGGSVPGPLHAPALPGAPTPGSTTRTAVPSTVLNDSQSPGLPARARPGSPGSGLLPAFDREWANSGQLSLVAVR